MSRNRVSVAPMMDWTDRHCRYFLRLLSPNAELYTEMVTAAAIRHGDAARLLRFDPAEHPVAVQLGGSEPELMAEAAKRAAEEGYDEININVGCPSDRVQSGQFGACLMANPELVAECYSAMSEAVDIPVTVKSRIGIDDQDSYGFLCRFVETVSSAGCRKFVVHARIALLSGLSPKQNRSVPPLDYARVYRLKADYSELEVHINGGFRTLDGVDAALEHVDGVMIGREAYQNPYFLAQLETHLNPAAELPDRRQIVEAMLPYIETQLAEGEGLQRITRHMLGLFAGQPGARSWRRCLSEEAHRSGATAEIVTRALSAMDRAAA
ncbi:MAG: tRNA dihydrouridine(20/20a) synthase DusA [Pseudomonadota bacterium]